MTNQTFEDYTKAMERLRDISHGHELYAEISGWVNNNLCGFRSCIHDGDRSYLFISEDRAKAEDAAQDLIKFINEMPKDPKDMEWL